MATTRVTVTLSDELLREIDLQDRNRSRFIQQAVEQELERRRRELLIASLESPHPETLELEADGLSEWIEAGKDSDLELVDMTQFRPLAWVPDEGWKEHPKRGARSRRSGRT